MKQFLLTVGFAILCLVLIGLVAAVTECIADSINERIKSRNDENAED